MVAASEVVDVSILIQDASPSRTNFGAMAIIAYHENGPEKFEYTTDEAGIASMTADGFGAGSDVRIKFDAIKAQNPKVKTIKVFNRAAPNAQSITLTPTLTTEGKLVEFEVFVNGVSTTVSRTIPAAATVNGEATALQALLNAITGVTAVDNTGSVTITPDDDEARIYLRGCPTHLTPKEGSADAGIASDLTAALLEDSGWYGFLIDSMSEAELNAAGAWAQSNSRVFHGQTADQDVLTGVTTDVASDFVAAGYHYAGVQYSADMVGQLSAALMGRMFSTNPGQSTWENQRLTSIQADNLTGTEYGNAKGKKCGLYVPIKGLDITRNISAASGRFFDLTRDSDWIKDTMQAAVITVLVNSEKVPHNASGYSQIEAPVRTTLAASVRRGILSPASVAVNVPTEAEVDPADRVARSFTGLTFSGRFAGAIHQATLAGELAA